MRHFKHVAVSAFAGLAALLFCPPAASAATATGDGSWPQREEVFQLIAHQTQINSVDLDGAGPTQGDEIVITGDLLRGTTKVGDYSQICTLTRTAPADEFDLQCAGDLSLAPGQLTIQGRFTVTAAGPGSIDMAITGGTGRYRAAHGFIRAVNLSAADTQLTVHLIR
ncbi:allene oxide cyclase barrel-like domain-containing protein [Streptomyces lydicus]|uniref:allene oxide cyclase barrel-like domain-containing protein n=1 Tax=Streptomyces lydicus TaxID=47763 RepID=UPI00341785E8